MLHVPLHVDSDPGTDDDAGQIIPPAKRARLDDDGAEQGCVGVGAVQATGPAAERRRRTDGVDDDDGDGGGGRRPVATASTTGTGTDADGQQQEGRPKGAGLRAEGARIQLDMRERPLADALRRLGDACPPVEVSALPVADIVIHPGGDAPPIFVERKTVADLAASIKDNRYHDQKDRLLEATNGDPRRIGFILEGRTLGGDPDAHVAGVQATVLYGAWVNTTVRDNMHVWPTGSTAESAVLVCKIARAASGATGTGRGGGRLLLPRQRRAERPGGLGACLLEQVPGMSAARADAVVAAFGGIAALVDVLRTRGVAPVADVTVRGPSGSERRIGPALAQAIADALVLSVAPREPKPPKPPKPSKQGKKTQQQQVPTDDAPGAQNAPVAKQQRKPRTPKAAAGDAVPTSAAGAPADAPAAAKPRRQPRTSKVKAAGAPTGAHPDDAPTGPARVRGGAKKRTRGADTDTDTADAGAPAASAVLDTDTGDADAAACLPAAV